MDEIHYKQLVDDIEVFRDSNITKNSNYLQRFLKNTCMMIEPRILSNIDTVFTNAYNVLGDSWNYVFYCGKSTGDHWSKVLPSYIELRFLDVDNFSKPEYYSDFCKNRSLWESLSGEFVLTIQADTWITNSSIYTIDNFIALNKSYIASNMNFIWGELMRENIYPVHPNFNGGLSLRKRLDMLKIIDQFPPEKTINNSKIIHTDAEDVYFTLGCYKLGLPLGNDEYCSHFSLHKIYKDDFFGIHQPCNTIKNQISQKFPLLKNLNPHLHLS
jgi:hypothetical protein